MSTAVSNTRAHGDLDCDDAEAILHDSIAENSNLRAQLAVALQAQDDLNRQVDLLRVEGDRIRALFDDVSRKNQSIADERDGLKEQVKMLHDELCAIEADAVPEGTLTYGTVSRDHMVTQYRQMSRINRGPLPPAIIAAVEAEQDAISAAMTTAGEQMLADVIRRAVRRRRRAATRTSRSR